jgi:hypothetical protein
VVSKGVSHPDNAGSAKNAQSNTKKGRALGMLQETKETKETKAMSTRVAVVRAPLRRDCGGQLGNTTHHTRE